MKLLATSLVVLVCLTSVTYADSSDPPKDETAAMSLSIAGSLVGPGLAALALANGDANSTLHAEWWPLLAGASVAGVIGPAFGQWYAGNSGVTRGLGLRVVGGLVGVAGGALFADSVFSSDSKATAGALLVAVGAAAFVGGTVDDIVGARRSARDYNRRHQLGITPLVSPTMHGFALAGTF